MSVTEGEKKITLNDMPAGMQCVIVKIGGHGGLRHRLMEMGFVKGETVTVIKASPLQDPVEYIVMDSHVSLRRSEADKIEVVPLSELSEEIGSDFNGVVKENIISNESLSQVIREKSHTFTVALVGNPNCGKTSLFNHATGLREKVGNYSGVTVDMKIGTFYHKGYTIRMVDLPGTYSVNEYSPEELCVREFLTKNEYDLILNIVDSSNLERNLYLTTQLIDMNVPMVLALNMFDELEAKNDKLDYNELSVMLGFPLVPTVASKGRGIPEVLQALINVFENGKNVTRHIHINYGNDIEKAILAIKNKISENKDIINIYSARYIAINTLEGTKHTLADIEKLPNGAEILSEAKYHRENLERAYGETIDTQLSNARYGFIRGALKETYTAGEKNKDQKLYRADDILTNKWIGFPLLFLFMWLMFEVTFIVGAYPQAWLDMFVSWFGGVVHNALPEGMFNDMVGGVIDGIGAVISFLPNIILLFFFIAIMEDTGYMARAAFMVDKVFHRFGLHGRSFIPYIMGFGCGVPAIMATRTLENKKDRMVTLLTIPFMSCSARLPVYIVLVSAFFTKYQGLILMSIYLIGIVFAVLTSLLLNKTVFRSVSEEFVMELPPYRIPTPRNILLHMWDRSVQYLQKMGTVILAASVIIWALEYFPHNTKQEQLYAQQIEQVQNDSSLTEEAIGFTVDSLTKLSAAYHSEHSFIGRFGHFIEPAVEVCGFDWHIGVALCTGIAAKEVVASTLGVLYQTDYEEDDEVSLAEKMKEQRWPEDSIRAGQPIYTPLVAYALMLFVLLSVPCFATLAAIKREAGWKWVTFTFIYTIFIAWSVSALVFQIGSLF
ncbi:MAG: ferrous iron transport protein B [Bacteroidales bacterium]|nr:ferrous iron transport protein B [Bacteroidales bacterium]